MATRKIGAEIALGGEREFNDAMKAINSNLKTLRTDMAATSAEFDGNADSIDAAEDREQILTLLQQRRRQKTERYIRQGQEIQKEAERQAEEKRLARRSARLASAKPRATRKSAAAK